MTFLFDPGRGLTFNGDWTDDERAEVYAHSTYEGLPRVGRLFPEVNFGNVTGMILYNDTDPTVGQWDWTVSSGWRHRPYRQPRPWKNHTPGRYRQRRRP